MWQETGYWLQKLRILRLLRMCYCSSPFFCFRFIPSLSLKRSSASTPFEGGFCSFFRWKTFSVTKFSSPLEHVLWVCTFFSKLRNVLRVFFRVRLYWVRKNFTFLSCKDWKKIWSLLCLFFQFGNLLCVWIKWNFLYETWKSCVLILRLLKCFILFFAPVM